MNHSARPELAAPATNLAVNLNQGLLWIFSGLALACYAFIFWTLLMPGDRTTRTAEAVLILATTIATMAALARQLPGQNVILAAVIIAAIGGIAHGVGAATGVPFGPFRYMDEAGPRLFDTLAWPMPAIWVIAVLNSRGLARLILRPWRKLKNYGYWLLGLTAALTLIFDVALEPFATRVKHFWLWQPTKLPFSWYGTPVVNFLGWIITILLILAFATPAMINKQLRQKSPPDYHPLGVWLLTFALCATGAVTHQLWPAAGFCILTAIVTTILALRGARW